MDKNLKTYFDRLDIKYKIHKHPAVFTVEESLKLKEKLPDVFHTKNLFLRDESKPRKYFLVSMDAYKRLDLKSLSRKLNVKKKLSFASALELKEKLKLTPGSVSLFGMIYAKRGEVILILGKEIWEARKVGFHPNINTSTLELKHEDLEKFYYSLKSEKNIYSLPTLQS